MYNPSIKLNRSLKRSLGFTLVEVLIATTLLAAAATGGVSVYKDRANEAMNDETVQMSADLVSSYKRFHTAKKRAPASITELLNSEHYVGPKKTPWGGTLSGGINSSGNAFTFTIPAGNTPQAQRLAGSLGHYNATSSGSIVTFQTSIPTVSTIEDQMLCRTAIAGSPGCNTMEVDLDVNNNDLIDIKNVSAQKVDFGEFSADSGVVDTITLQDSLILGNSSIGFAPNQININSNTTSLSGNMNVAGDLVGNNSNISGVKSVTAEIVSSQTLTSTQGVISSVSGNSLDYNEGDFASLTSLSTKVGTGTFDEVSTQVLNAVSTTTETFNGGIGTFDSIGADIASGNELSLTGILETSRLNSLASNLGVVKGTTANFTGEITGKSFSGGPASFTRVSASGAVSGGNFYGSSFCTSSACVGSNRAAINTNASGISTNASNASSNATRISNNLKSINVNKKDISDNSIDNGKNKLSITNNLNAINSNVSLIAGNTTKNASNASANSANTGRINTNANSIITINKSVTGIESDIAALQSRWSICESSGGCK